MESRDLVCYKWGGMDEARSNEYDPKPSPRFWIWAAMILVVIYPLSVGPAVRLLGHTCPGALDAIYTPLGYLHEHVPVARVTLDAYLRFWGVP